MIRRPTTQDITWLLDLHRNKQLDLDPPYQRRSVWTRKDKQFFLDTIFRNYPSPAIFLHKTISDSGHATYHVVDGKQRTQTILGFVANRIKLAKTFGDLRLDGKKWSDLRGERELKQVFWNYQITIEMIDIPDGSVVNEVFDRLNRNARKLTRQELRHARFDGWLITEAENESERAEWTKLGVVTTARAKRMTDAQFLSELFLIVLEGDIIGFDQDILDQMYVKYDDPIATVEDFDQEETRRHITAAKDYILAMEETNKCVSTYARAFANFYTLWAFVILTDDLPPADLTALRYDGFMRTVNLLQAQEDLATLLGEKGEGEYKVPLAYLTHYRGPSTDRTPRRKRLESLREGLRG